MVSGKGLVARIPPILELLLNLHPDSLGFPLGIWHEVGMLHFDIRLVSLKKLKLKPCKHHCYGNVQLGKSETNKAWRKSVRKKTQQTCRLGIMKRLQARINSLDAQTLPRALAERDKILLKLRILDPSLRSKRC